MRKDISSQALALSISEKVRRLPTCFHQDLVMNC